MYGKETLERLLHVKKNRNTHQYNVAKNWIQSTSDSLQAPHVSLVLLFTFVAYKLLNICHYSYRYPSKFSNESHFLSIAIFCSHINCHRRIHILHCNPYFVYTQMTKSFCFIFKDHIRTYGIIWTKIYTEYL